MESKVMFAPDDVMHNLEFLYETKQVEEGLETVRALLQKHPHDGRVWEVAGLLYRLQNNFKLTLCSLEIANTLVPLSVDSQIALADSYLYVEKNKLALMMFEYIIEKKGVSHSLLNTVACRLEAMGESDLALSIRRQTCQEPEGTAEYHYSLAYHMGHTNYPAEMVEAEIKQAIRLDPLNVEYKAALAGFLSQSDREEEAYQYIKEMAIDYILTMDCNCCLQRIANVFHAVGDSKRLNACLGRMHVLKKESCNKRQ